LRAQIRTELARPREARREGYFRLPVDRAFVMRGHGVVVTGTAVAGAIAAGETVRVLPRGTTARVRGLEGHGPPATRAGQGGRRAGGARPGAAAAAARSWAMRASSG